ncbi:MAG: TIGR03560 family F420-dependent LLM class oxidoreductase [Chloroflexota bacterium]
MRAGVIVPQGWTGEYDGVDAPEAWARTVAAARRADVLGFDSIWVFDHFHTTPEPTESITFEAFTVLAALAPLTTEARLGQLVTCAAYRNPALLAKMISTLDTVSDGRAELGLGAGWKRDEWLAYGYGFPSLRVRQERLRDTLEIVTRMLGPGRATYEGTDVSVDGAFNEPKPVQRPGVPIIVGGNGRDVTWRLAARYADELNLDNVPPDELDDANAVLASRCEEIGRDPASLALSVHIWWEALDPSDRRRRIDLLSAYAEHRVDRVMALVRDAATSDEAVDAFADDCRAAGLELGAATPASAF